MLWSCTHTNLRCFHSTTCTPHAPCLEHFVRWHWPWFGPVVPCLRELISVKSQGKDFSLMFVPHNSRSRCDPSSLLEMIFHFSVLRWMHRHRQNAKHDHMSRSHSLIQSLFHMNGETCTASEPGSQIWNCFASELRLHYFWLLKKSATPHRMVCNIKNQNHGFYT